MSLALFTTGFTALQQSGVLSGGGDPQTYPSYTADEIRSMIRLLSLNGRATLNALTKPFGWYNPNLEVAAQKIAEEVRTAANPTERALADFVVANMRQTGLSSVTFNPDVPSGTTSAVTQSGQSSDVGNLGDQLGKILDAIKGTVTNVATATVAGAVTGARTSTTAAQQASGYASGLQMLFPLIVLGAGFMLVRAARR